MDSCCSRYDRSWEFFLGQKFASICESLLNPLSASVKGGRRTNLEEGATLFRADRLKVGLPDSYVPTSEGRVRRIPR